MAKMLLAVLVLVVMGIVGYLVLVKDDNKTSDDNDTNVSVSDNDTTNNSSDEDIVEENDSEDIDYTINLTSSRFSIEEMTAKPGDTLRVKLVGKSSGHDFVIDELDVQSRLLDAGEEQILEIEIPEDAAGEEYEYYCNVSNHRQLGMVGTLSIEN